MTDDMVTESQNGAESSAIQGHSPLLGRFLEAQAELRNQILGQEALVDRLLIALLCDGHLLVEGAPGLAKTRAINRMTPVWPAASISWKAVPVQEKL